MAQSVSPTTESTPQVEQPSLMPGNPLAAVPYGRLEVRRFLDAQVLDSGPHKVVAFGITGHGKSSFLNFVLKAKEEVFLTSVEGLLEIDSVTKKTQARTAMIGGKQWMLIDTPGFFDSDQLQDGIGESCEAQVEQQKQEFRSNIMEAFLEAGSEISAFLLVYNGSARWSLEMSQQMKFLNSIEFPWSHCILVITHADTAFKRIVNDEQRYGEIFKAVGNPLSRLPEQLKKLMRSASNHVILVESLRRSDEYHASVVTRMKDYMAQIEEEHGKYRNELFAFFGKKYSADCHIAYMSLLQDDKDSSKLKRLIKDTKEDATGFVRAGQKVAKDHNKFIRTMEVIAQLADLQTLTPAEKKAGATGKMLAVIGVPLAVVSVLLMPVTVGVPALMYNIGTVLAVGGLHLAFSSLMRSIKTKPAVKQAQSCLEQGQQSLQELYSHYQSLLTKIDEAGLVKHPSASDSLVAHLLAVHAHNAQERSPELLQAAQELSVFHTLRKGAQGEISPEKATNISANCALPIGFNILAKEMDVAQAVGTTLSLVNITTNSTTMDAALLRSSCIQTLLNECSAIKTLCNIRD